MTDLLRHISQHGTNRGGRTIGVPQVPDRLSGLVYRGTQLGPRATQQAVRGIGVRFIETAVCLQQSRDSGTSLNQSIVHFSGEPVSFIQHRLETSMHLTYAEFVSSPDRSPEQQDTASKEPPGPVKARLLDDFHRPFRNLLWIVHLKCRNAEVIVSGRKISVVSHAGRGRICPALIKAVQHVAKSDPLLGTQLNDTVVHFDLGVVRRQLNSPHTWYFDSIRDNMVDHNR